MNKQTYQLTQAQGEYLKYILNWLYENKFPYDEFRIMEYNGELKIGSGNVDHDDVAYYETHNYKISILKYTLEIILGNRSYDPDHQGYLNKLKPLYKHIKSLEKPK